MGFNPIGSCESQALGLDFHSRKEPCVPQDFGLGPLCFSKMGSKRWTWVLNLLKSFGSQILDLGLNFNKVIKASRVELGLQFKQSDVNLKLWT